MSFSNTRPPLWRSLKLRPGNPAFPACLLLLFAAFLWGSGNVANKTILANVDPVSAVFLRTSIASLALVWPAWREAAGAWSGAWVRSVLPGSVMFALALLVQQWGYQTATVTNASFLVNATCVMTPILGVVIWRQRLQPRTLLCAGLVLLGALFMSGAWWSLASVTIGDALCLVSALFYSLWVILIGLHLQRFRAPATTTLAQCLCVALLSAPFVLSADPGTPRNWAGALPEAVYLGLFSTAAAFALTAAAQTRVSASTTAILVSAESLFGGAMGVVFLDERPGEGTLFGAALILIAVLVMALRPEMVQPDPHPARTEPA